MSAPRPRTAEQALGTDSAYDDLRKIEEAFRYAQGYDVAGWEGHMRDNEVRDIFEPALERLRARLLARAGSADA